MNYLQCYLNLIEKRIIIEPDANNITEKHHIIPRSIYKTSYAKQILYRYIDKNSVVNLTLREHYIAHMLLVKIFESDSNCYIKMLYAWNIMNNRGNSRKYATFKSKHSNMMSLSLKGKPSRAKNKKWSEEAKQKKSLNHYMKGKTYSEIYGKEKAEHLLNIRKVAKLGYKFTEDQRKNLMLGLSKRGKEWRENVSKGKKGKRITETTKEKIKNYANNRNRNVHVDQTLYTFRNVITGEIIKKRKIDMRKDYNCKKIYSLIQGKTKICNNWEIIV